MDGADDPGGNVHSFTAGVVARALSLCAPTDRKAVLVGFLNASGAGLMVIEGPAAAARQVYDLYDHIAGKLVA